MKTSIRGFVLHAFVVGAFFLWLQTTNGSQASEALILSEQEIKIIADLMTKKQVSFDDFARTARVDPGLWYAVDWQQKKNLTILLARRLAAKNKMDFASINIVSKLTGRMLATYSIFEGFRTVQ